MEKLLKQAGADRVSEDAKEALQEILEDHAMHIGKKAYDLALHANRKTVKGPDIKLASKH
jgi:DNA-binding protein